MKIELQPGDARLGKRGEDGLIEEWPAVDLFGNPVTNVVGPALLRVGPHFVLVPNGTDTTDLEVVLQEPLVIDVTAEVVRDEPPALTADQAEALTAPEPPSPESPKVDDSRSKRRRG